MYIDFMDTLRNIQNGIYPQVQIWRTEVETLRNETEVLRNETQILKDSTHDIVGGALASELNAASWAAESQHASVIKHVWNPVTDVIESLKL